MDITNLVQVRNDISLVKTKTTTFYPHRNYRCICIDENNIKQYLVYGVVFDEETFNELFIYSHTKIMNDFENIGLLSNGKPLNKKQFIEHSDMHLYGHSKLESLSFTIGDGRESTQGIVGPILIVTGDPTLGNASNLL